MRNTTSLFDSSNLSVNCWQVTLMSDEMTVKTFVMPPQPEVLSNYLHINFPKATYYSLMKQVLVAYRHTTNCKRCINNIVVNAADIPGTQKDKLQKEDKRDSRKIARCLRPARSSKQIKEIA